MAPRHAERVEAVKRLREVAARLGVARAPDNAGRQKVEAMRQAILAASALADADRPEVESAWNAYLSTWADQEAGDGAAAPGGAGADGGPAQSGRQWKFQATQLTYNCKEGEWASHDDAVLRPPPHGGPCLGEGHENSRLSATSRGRGGDFGRGAGL